jgi:hypothetical protein
MRLDAIAYWTFRFDPLTQLLSKFGRRSHAFHVHLDDLPILLSQVIREPVDRPRLTDAARASMLMFTPASSLARSAWRSFNLWCIEYIP